MLRISLSCDSVPALYFRSKRDDAERLGGRRDLARDRFRRADIERAAFDFLIEMRRCHRRPAALAADPIAHALVAGPEFLARLLVGVGDVAGRVHGNRLHGLAELRKRAMVEIDIGLKPLGIAADDGERQRQVVARGADDGFRAAADADPGLAAAGLRSADRRADRSAAGASAPPRSPAPAAAAPRTDRACLRTIPRSARARSRTAETTR